MNITPSTDIQTAINANPKERSIFIEPGTYIINAPIILKANTLIYGAGAILIGAPK